MDKFEASNGATVQWFTQSLSVATKGGEEWLAPWAVAALREFFRAERDEELGRWRWPERPEYVVYPSALFQHPANPDRVMVVNEQNGALHRAHREDGAGLFGFFGSAAAAYFEAHPGRKPWEDAKEGEVWVLTLPNSTQAWFVNGAYFQSAKTLTNIALDDGHITDGRRVWPEEA